MSAPLIGFVCVAGMLLLIALRFALTPEIASLTFQISAFLRLLVAIGALVLLHNLYAGGSASSRQLLRRSRR